MNNELIHSDPPHIHTKRTITGIRIDVLIALMPTVIMSTFIQGGKSILIILSSLAAAVISDIICDLIFRRKTKVSELESAVTGVIFALMLPYKTELWIAATGAAAAVIVFKQLFGLMGRSYIHPAAGAYLIIYLLLISIAPSVLLSDCICTESVIALIIGLIYLLIRKVISWHIPFLYILVFGFAIFVSPPQSYSDVPGFIYLAAIFIAPAYASSPATPGGKAVFGIFGGLIAYALSYILSYELSVTLSVIIMNILSPMIERFTIPRSWRYGS